MKIKEIKKIPLFRMAFKLSAGLILGKRAAVFLCDAFMYFDELLVDHMQKHRYDNNEVGNAYNKALNIVGIKPSRESNNEDRFNKNMMGFEHKK